MNTVAATEPAATSSETQKSAATGRIMAIDALRGFDLFWILGANEFVYALHRMNQGPITTGLANQLEHKDWQGFAFYDLIFPLFVFIVGEALPVLVFQLVGQAGRDRSL